MSNGKVEIYFSNVDNEKIGKEGEKTFDRPEVVMEFTGSDGIPFVTYVKAKGFGAYDEVRSQFNADGDDQVGDDPDDERLLLALANAFANITL